MSARRALPLRVCLFGASGRMGCEIVRFCAQTGDAEVTGATVRAGSALVGVDAGSQAGGNALGVALTTDRQLALDQAQVAIDFTLPQALAKNLQACLAAGTPIVVGTTGLEDDGMRALDEAAREIPVLYARNTSVGINLLGALAATAARALGDDFDIEIVETHHRDKVDVPSGTALELAERLAEARLSESGEGAEAPANQLTVGRTRGKAPREPGTIGINSIRAGAVTGEHEIVFGGTEEEIRVSHRALTRAVFARGALRAAAWLADRKPGLYGMGDVLGL